MATFEPSTTSRCASRPARSSGCSDPTVRARPPWSASCRPCSRPPSGTATVDGFDVVKHPEQVRRRIGLAGQFAAVDENLTGFENLRMVGLSNHMERSHAVSSVARTARGVRARRVRQQARQDLLGRHASASRPRGGAPGQSADPLPRRADHGPRPPEPPGPLDDHRGPRRRRHHRIAHDPVPRRGRPPLQAARGARPRQDHRRRAPRRS